MEHIKVTFTETETKVTRDYSFINRKGHLGHMSVVKSSINANSDKYNKNIGIIVAIMKSLFFSRRVIAKVVCVLLEEQERVNSSNQKGRKKWI